MRPRSPRNRGGGTSRPGLYAPRLTNGHGEQCSPLLSRHFVRPAPNPCPPVAAHIVRHKMQTCSPQKCGPVRRKTAAGHTFRPGLYAPRLTNGHGEQCSPLRSRHFVRPAPKPAAPCSGAQRAPQNRGPVRRETASLRQPRAPCSGAQRAPQNRGPVRHKAADLRRNRHHPDTTAKEEPP